MRIILYVFVFLFIGSNFTSCAPESITETEEYGCCGEDDHIPPPPPPDKD